MAKWDRDERDDRAVAEYIKMAPMLAGFDVELAGEPEPILRKGALFWQGVHFRSGFGVVAILRETTVEVLRPPVLGQQQPSIATEKGYVVALFECGPVTGMPLGARPLIMRQGVPEAEEADVKAAGASGALGTPAVGAMVPGMFATAQAPQTSMCFVGGSWVLSPDTTPGAAANHLILRRRKV